MKISSELNMKIETKRGEYRRRGEKRGSRSFLINELASDESLIQVSLTKLSISNNIDLVSWKFDIKTVSRKFLQN